MPATSIDTLLACSVMVVLVLSSMVGLYTVVHPFLQEQPSWHKTRMNRELAEYLLLEHGNPSDWGSDIGASLTSFGLAESVLATPFVLDIDKVTRLNGDNVYNLSFLYAFSAFGAQDKPFKIRIEPIFDVSVNLASKNEGSLTTIYRFNVTTKKSNLPIAASLRCYAIVGNEVSSNASSTSSSGEGSVEVSLPRYLGGTALLIMIARVEPRVMSYTVHRFNHSVEGEPHPAGTYATLSPIDHKLRADLVSSTKRILYARVFSYGCWFGLTQINETLYQQFYGVPKLLDPSPMILVGTGVDGATWFAEWVAYPQIPLDFGSSFTREYDVMNAYDFTFLVTVNSAMYECEIMLGGT